ncbi:phage regulatory CII family protein [Variovorax boronicumulans]|uniref:phage regulatory CII family protein n=1 Tax=Variovorax boronicumulans TaxID=436515 RepID=UPI001C562173
MDDLTPLLQTAVTNYRSPDSNGSNGSLGLSKLMGLSNGSLSRKVSPNDPVSHLSPAEFVTVCKTTGDHSAFLAMAMELGYLPMPMHTASTRDLAPSLSATFKELGEWLQAASAANSAPSLSDNGLMILQRELIEGIAASVQTFCELKAKHVGAKPALRVA